MTHATERRRTRAARVFYDGQCRLCLKSVALLRRLDWFRQLSFEDARQADADRMLPGVSPGRLLEQMHLLPPNGARIYGGFDALRWMSWRLPLLWPLAPFLYIPGVPAIGRRLYLWVARNRFRLVPCHGGVCSLPRTGAKA